MLLQRSVDDCLADKKKMTKYICERLIVDGMSIEVAYGKEEGPVWAVLFPTWNNGNGWELAIESNEPEWVSVKEVYKFFRRQDMTSLEWHQELFWEMKRFSSLDPAPTEPASEATPYWNADLAELWFGDKLIKAFREEAENQRTVLAAFQKQEWRHRVEDPIPGRQCERLTKAKGRLRDTITGLNADHKTPGIIRFRGDGTGRGVIWVFCE